MQSGAVAGAAALGVGGASSASAQSRVETLDQGDMSTVPTTQYFNYFNNQWGNEAQPLTVYGYDDGSVGWEFDSGGGGINYPEVFCGHRAWGTDTGAPELSNITIDQIDELTFSFDAEVNASGHWNLVEELWLLNGPPDGNGSTITHEVMIVCDYGGGHRDAHSPFEQHEVLTDQFGNTMDFWDDITGGSGDRFLIFGITEPAQCGQIDITPVLEWVVNNIGDVESSRRVSAVEFGTELFDGPSGEAMINDFTVTINGSTYETTGTGDCRGGTGGSAPDAPGDVWTESTTTDSGTVGWSSVQDASEYDVFLDGSYEDTTSGTQYTFDGLSEDTSYTAGVEATNEYGNSDRTTHSFRTDDTGGEGCPVGEGEQVDGQWVCDVDGDGDHRDVTADGEVGQDDVVHFFENQHRDAWKRDDLFDFSGSGSVGHGDVVALFEHVSL